MTETYESQLEEIKAIHKKAALAHDEGDPHMEIQQLLNELFEEEHTDWLIEQVEQKQKLTEVLKVIQEKVVKLLPHTDASFEIYDLCNKGLRCQND